MRALIVEDDLRIAGLLSQGLKEEGFDTLHVADGFAGLDAALKNEFEVIVLDLMLPRLDGFEVARRLRHNGVRTPIVVLTARESDGDVVKGLNLGADDYVTKPFSFEVFLAHIRAVLRRGPITAPVYLRIGDLEIDCAGHVATRGGQGLPLTPREFKLLELLARSSPRVVPRQMIMEEIWGYSSEVTENNLEAFVSQLRGKVDRGDRSKLIRTIRGVGYSLKDGGSE